MSITGTERGLSPDTEQFLAICAQQWPADQPKPTVMTRTPGRLDVMGGMADFSGGLALQMPINEAVHVAAGPREDQRVSIESVGYNENNQPSRFDWPLSTFYQSDGQIVTGEHLREQFDACPWARHVAGACLALLESGKVPHFAGGVTLLIASDIPIDAGLGSSAALQVGVAKAICGLFKAEINERELAQACRIADREVVGAELGLIDHLTCLSAEPDALLQIRTHPETLLGALPLAKGAKMVGVVSGVRLEIRHQRYTDNRTSSLMGQYVIERIIEASGEAGDPSTGTLAAVAPNEYVRRFRDHLPVKLKGSDFIKAVGPSALPDTVVRPDTVYKVRSRTEHHVYENDRTHRFLERLARVRRTGEHEILVEAGELMYASHWSYGQRCGMGSLETDQLVNLIRQQGKENGLLGAKVTGGGCGGTLAVLMTDTEEAHAALEEACAAYTDRNGIVPTILTGSSPGAMLFGSRPLD